MQFNGLELSAIVKLAKAMAAADGKIAKEELTLNSATLYLTLFISA